MANRPGGVIAFGRGTNGFLQWTPSYYLQSSVRLGNIIDLHILTYANSDLVLLPIFLKTKTDWGPSFSYVDLYWGISLVVTTASTTLIVYRIFDVSKTINKSTRYYNSVTEILVESAALYTVVILICGVLLVARACRPDILWLVKVNDCFSSIRTTVAVSVAVFISSHFGTDTRPRTGYCTDADNFESSHWAFRGGWRIGRISLQYCFQNTRIQEGRR